MNNNENQDVTIEEIMIIENRNELRTTLKFIKQSLFQFENEDTKQTLYKLYKELDNSIVQLLRQ